MFISRKLYLHVAFEPSQIVACIVAASFHIAVGFTMAYSATLIPHLEKEDAELHATKEQTSWIGEIAQICGIYTRGSKDKDSYTVLSFIDKMPLKEA